MRKCFYQVFGSGKGIRLEGWGNCEICKADEKNKECKGYIGISVIIIDIKEGGRQDGESSGGD